MSTSLFKNHLSKANIWRFICRYIKIIWSLSTSFLSWQYLCEDGRIKNFVYRSGVCCLRNQWGWVLLFLLLNSEARDSWLRVDYTTVSLILFFCGYLRRRVLCVYEKIITFYQWLWIKILFEEKVITFFFFLGRVEWIMWLMWEKCERRKKFSTAYIE